MVRTGEIPYIRVFDKLGDYRFDRDTIAQWVRTRGAQPLTGYQANQKPKKKLPLKPPLV